jgi:hypothetical protein
VPELRLDERLLVVTARARHPASWSYETLATRRAFLFLRGLLDPVDLFVRTRFELGSMSACRPFVEVFGNNEHVAVVVLAKHEPRAIGHHGGSMPRRAGASQRFAPIGTRVSRHTCRMKASMFVVVAVACGSSPQARIAALASHVPIAVEIWAPW